MQLAEGQGLNPLQLTRSRHEPLSVLCGGHRECAGRVWCALRACWSGSKSVLAARCCQAICSSERAVNQVQDLGQLARLLGEAF